MWKAEGRNRVGHDEDSTSLPTQHQELEEPWIWQKWLCFYTTALLIYWPASKLKRAWLQLKSWCGPWRNKWLVAVDTSILKEDMHGIPPYLLTTLMHLNNLTPKHTKSPQWLYLFFFCMKTHASQILGD